MRYTESEINQNLWEQLELKKLQGNLRPTIWRGAEKFSSYPKSSFKGKKMARFWEVGKVENFSALM